MSELKVLLVDDEEEFVSTLAERLELRNIKTLIATDGGQALQIIQTDKPPVVVLDVMMPDLSGLEVLRYLRRDPRLEKIPVIVVSAKSLSSDIKNGLDAGANVYLTKPVAFQDLNTAVREVIETAAGEVV